MIPLRKRGKIIAQIRIHTKPIAIKVTNKTIFLIKNDGKALTQTRRRPRMSFLTIRRLLNLRIDDQIDEETFARKQMELRDRLASIKLQLDVVDRSHDETAELALKVFELSQTLTDKWLTADYATKRRILEIVCLNCRLIDTTLFSETSQPRKKKALRRDRRRASCSR